MNYLKRILALAILCFALPAAVFAAAPVSFSRNWAGYVATGQTYDGAYATWTVPTVASQSANAADATWVGIGGYASTDLIQAGTFAKVQSGKVSYEAWYELLPAGMMTVPLTVSAGDSITTSIRSRDASHWTITIADNTSGQSYAVNVTYSSSRSSAEWVEERPTYTDGSFVPLDSFGSIAFSNVGASVNGSDQSYAALGAIPLIMGNNNQAEVVEPSSYTNTGFTLDRTTAEASDTATTTPSRRGLPERYQVQVVPIVSGGWHIVRLVRVAL